MLPVSDFPTVKELLPKVHTHGVRVCGFFLFVESNHPVMKYMQDNGLIELDIMLTNTHATSCGIFTFEPITSKWIKHARSANNLWWRVFGASDGQSIPAIESKPPSGPHADIQEAMHTSPGSITVQINQQQTISLEEAIITNWHKYWEQEYNRGVAIEVANYFGVMRDEFPGVILFSSLKQRRFWWLKLSHILTEDGVVSYFARVFSSPEFKDALKQAEQDHGYS